MGRGNRAGSAAWGSWGGHWGNCDWNGGNVNINNNNNFNKNNNFNRNVNRGQGGQGNWQHNPQHRGNAPYGDRGTANKFGGQGAAGAAAAVQVIVQEALAELDVPVAQVELEALGEGPGWMGESPVAPVGLAVRAAPVVLANRVAPYSTGRRRWCRKTRWSGTRPGGGAG